MIKKSMDIEFDYDGKVRSARKELYFINGNNTMTFLTFTYKDVPVKVKLEEGDIEEHIAEHECKLVDTLGKERYLILREYRKRVSDIQSSHVVLNNKVYNVHKGTIDSGNFSFNWKRLKMGDGTFIDGSLSFPIMKQVKRKEDDTIKNLVNKVKKYYEETRIEPDEFAINEELTLEYMKLVIWINKNTKID